MQLQFPDSWFEDEVKEGFYVPALMKRAWAAQLEVLADVARVCEKHRIRWFADWGTLLGAIRHGGYIPWDDDIDLCMLRDDYIRFNAIAEQELPKGYYIPRDLPDSYHLHTTVWNSHGYCLEKAHLEKFHGFPFIAGLDIFVLDYLAPNPEDEAFRQNLSLIVYTAAVLASENKQTPEEMERLAAQIEELLQVKLDKKKPLKNQLFSLAENLFSLYTEDKGREVALMYHWIMNDPYKYSTESFLNPVMLPFEMIEVPVPSDYDQILKIEFGDYMKYRRAGGAHTYPFYTPMIRHLKKSTGKNDFPFKYRFSMSDLAKPDAGNGDRADQMVKSFLQLTDKAHLEIRKSIEANEPDTAKKLLEVCQDNAIQTGTMLEQTRKEKISAVGILEEYCEITYQTHEMLTTHPEISANEVFHRLDELLHRIKNSLKMKKEVLFLPYKASHWSRLESIWLEAKTEPDCESYVIPVPYFYRKFDGTPGEMHYEGDLFPSDVPILDYNNYDFQKRRPDMIFIQNPYDEYNLTISVYPFFYARNLKQYTDQLVYIPPFVLDEIEPTDLKSITNMENYVTVPGVMQADRVVVQSEQMRLAYIDFLTKSAGNDTKTIWEEKIICSSPIPFLKTR